MLIVSLISLSLSLQNRNNLGIDLHGGALSRQGGEADDITEVDGDRVEGLSLNRLTTL